jgi:peptidoglycan/xylan/chitin deacetylase (PgdA/CDA1 family)
MTIMRQAGMKGVSVSEALQFPQRAVAITVDDGCETDLLEMAPLLVEHGFKATFYITAGRLGGRGYLSAAQLRELSEKGFEIGCHSMTHAYLSDLNDLQLKSEIADSKNLLEQLLGKKVEHFSCPGGRFSARAVQMVKAAGYRTLAHSMPKANSPQTDPFSLGRVAVTRNMGEESFRDICQGRGLWKPALGGAIRNGAKRILGNRTYDRIRERLLPE